MEDRGHLVKQAGKIFLLCEIHTYYGFSVGVIHHNRLKHCWSISTLRVLATNLLQWRAALRRCRFLGIDEAFPSKLFDAQKIRRLGCHFPA